MNIAVVSKEFHPFVDSTGKGRDAARFVEEFASFGHDVVVVIPFPSGEDLNAYSVAKRLVPITVDVDGAPTKVTRYDGRTASGFPIHFLECDISAHPSPNESGVAHSIEAFGKAAGALLAGLNEPVDVCFSVGGEASCVPAVFTEQGNGNSRPAHVLVIDDENHAMDPFERGMGAADRVILADRGVEGALRKQNGELLDKMAGSGRVIVLKRPCGDGSIRNESNGRLNKAGFQLKMGLPVRADVPLFCYLDTTPNVLSDSLGALLKRDVQIVALSLGKDGVPIRERYPDRLVEMTEQADPDEVVAASDVCVVGEDGSAAVRAISLGTLPMVGPGVGDEFVDLEPSCRTGSAVVLSSFTVQGFEEGFGRLLSAFTHRDAYYRLSRRLPEFVPTWKNVAGHYLQVAGSIQLRPPQA